MTIDLLMIACEVRQLVRDLAPSREALQVLADFDTTIAILEGEILG